MGHSDYELLDFGAGRKLERFGPVVLDRPSPAAERAKKSRPELWCKATARYDRTHGDEGAWTAASALPQEWTIVFCLKPENRHVADAKFTFRLQPSPFGHVGVFPEQFENWRWIAQQAAKWQRLNHRPPKILNLFAYTGGSTLAAAVTGAEVVHIDAARNIIERARENAELSGLAGRPIRWITEDVMKFCRRELKRGNRYDAVILDPPSYGHGPKGEPWKIDNDLLPLLKMCGELTADRRGFVLATCHSPGIGPAELAAYLAEGIVGNCSQPPTVGELFVATTDARKLSSGVYARWPG